MVEQSKYNGNLSEPRKFPQGFQWGSATAPFQVEGDSGVRKTDWDTFNKKKKIFSSGEGPNWWVQGNAEKDFQTMKGLGLNAQRLGFEWGRIEPEQGKINQEAIRRYREMIDFLKDKNMTPMVTLSHFTLPEWMAKQGGWANKNIREAFRRYSEIVADNFPDVPYWITINESNVQAVVGYLAGAWPPEKKGRVISYFASVAPNMIAAHDLAGNELTRQTGTGKVGIANSVLWLEPENKDSILDKLTKKVIDSVYNYKFLKGTIENSDFNGLNYYSGNWVRYGIPTNHKEDPKSDIGLSIVPGFFLEALQYAHRVFKKPIIITENGIADKEDKMRAFYILTHLIALQEAVRRGVDVRGYYHWSTVDILEWEKGFGPRFGLIANDPRSGERALRQSAQLYGEIAKSNEIDVNKLEKYLTPEQKELTRNFLQTLKT